MHGQQVTRLHTAQESSATHDMPRANERSADISTASENPGLTNPARLGALDDIVPVVYEELRVIARRHLARMRRANAKDGTFVTTALVNEVYLKLADQSDARWKDRAHFLALAARAMRHLLIDHAKAGAALKRGGGKADLIFEEVLSPDTRAAERLLEIDEALQQLATLDPRLARVVECRFFGGLTEEEIAEALDVTVRTVQRDWVKARAAARVVGRVVAWIRTTPRGGTLPRHLHVGRR